MKVLADNNVIGVFSQGQMQGGKQEFGVLRSYLVSRLLWDPMMTEEEYQAEIKGSCRPITVPVGSRYITI